MSSKHGGVGRGQSDHNHDAYLEGIGADKDRAALRREIRALADQARSFEERIAALESNLGAASDA